MWQTTRRTGGTGTEAAGTTEMTTTATGASGDATAMKMKRGDHTDIAHTGIERGHALAHDHHTNALTTETAMSAATDPAATEIVAHLDHVPLAGVATKTITRNAASPIPVRNDPDLLGRNLDHRTGLGEMTTADIKGVAHLHMSVPSTDSQNRIARHPRRRSVTRQRSKQSARSVWQPCSRMLRNWKSTVERDLRISMHKMRSSARRMIARDPIGPISLVAYGRKPRVSILGEDCKVNVAVAMMTEFSVAISLLEERTFEKACVHIA